jgi:hypothetical protein
MAGRRSHITKKKLRDKAKARNLKWVGLVPINSISGTQWECSKKHRWFASLNSVSGCPECKRIARALKESDYHALAEMREITWVGPLPRNTISTSKWRCPQGHEWWATHASIKYGTKCPHCAPHQATYVVVD